MWKHLAKSIGLTAATAVIATTSIACGGAPAAPTPAQPTAPAKAAEATKASTAPAAPTTAPAATKAAAAAQFPKVDIKLAHVVNTETSWHKGCVKFAELLKERTNGAVNLQIYPNSQLGGEKDLVEQVKNGIIQITIASPGTMAMFDGWGPVGVYNMPYIFPGDSDEAMYPKLVQLARGPVMTEVAAKAAQVSGMRSLTMDWWYGSRHLTTKSKQVTKVEDLKNMKIRTVDAPMNRAAMAALGASVAPMAFSEVYSALQMGVVDGQENPLNTIYTSKFYEVQKYLTLTGHLTQTEVMVINEKFYQGLQPELRAVIDKAAMEASDYQSDLQLKANKQNLQDLQDKGMVVNTVDLKAFAEKTKDAWKEFEPLFGKGFYEKVKQSLQ